jgi:hypothetical protein
MTECSKRVHPTPWHASRALEAIRRRRGSQGGKGPTGWYLCPACGGWHLTSKSKPQVPPWRRAESGGPT